MKINNCKDMRQSAIHLNVSLYAIPGLKDRSPVVLRYKRGSIPVDAVMSKVHKHMGVGLVNILSKDRRRPVSDARHVAMFLVNKYSLKTCTETAKAFQRDHTTVLAGIKRVVELCETDDDFAELVKKIEIDLA